MNPFLNDKHWITSIILTLICALISPLAKAQDQNSTTNEPIIRALIVGISEYKYIDKANCLDYADDDAKLFYDFLLTGAMGDIKRENITLLTNEQSDYATVFLALKKILTANAVKSNDISIFYFAGHGDCQSKINGAYFLTYDSPTNGDYSLNGGISIDDIDIYIQKASKKGVDVRIITDACRSGKLLSSNGYNESTLYLSKLTEEYNRCIKMVSCGEKESSLESKDFGGGHGAFTYFLVKGLSGYADYYGNRDGIVKLKELESFVDEGVTQSTNQMQNPLIRGNRLLDISKVIGKPDFKDKSINKIFSKNTKKRSFNYQQSSYSELDTIIPELNLPDNTPKLINQALAYGCIIDTLPKYYSKNKPIAHFVDCGYINKDTLSPFVKTNADFIKRGEHSKKWDLSSSDYKKQLKLLNNQQQIETIKSYIKLSKKYNVPKLNILKTDSFIAYNDLGILINNCAYYFPRPIKDFSMYNAFPLLDTLQLLIQFEGKARILKMPKTAFLSQDLYNQFNKESSDTLLLYKLIPQLKNVAIELKKEKALNTDAYRFFNFVWNNKGISKYTLLGGTLHHMYPLENLFITQYKSIDTIRNTSKWSVKNNYLYPENSNTRIEIKDTIILLFDQFKTSKRAFSSTLVNRKIYISQTGNIYEIVENTGIALKLKFIDYPKSTFAQTVETVADWENLEYAVILYTTPVINKAVYGNHLTKEITQVNQAVELLRYTLKNHPQATQLDECKFRLQLLTIYGQYLNSQISSSKEIEASVIDSISALIGSFPSKSYLSVLKAEFEKGMQHYANANIAYKVALTNVPKWSKPSLGISDVYDLTGNNDSALVYISRAIKLGRSSFFPEDILRYYLHNNYYDSSQNLVINNPFLHTTNSNYALELADYYSRTGQIIKCLHTIGYINNIRKPSEKLLRIMTRALISPKYLVDEFKRLDQINLLSSTGKLFYLYNLLLANRKVEAQLKIAEYSSLPPSHILSKSLNLVASSEVIKTSNLEIDILLNLLRLKLYKKHYYFDKYNFLSDSINEVLNQYITFINNNNETNNINTFLESQLSASYNASKSKVNIISNRGSSFILLKNARYFVYQPYIAINCEVKTFNWPIVIAEEFNEFSNSTKTYTVNRSGIDVVLNNKNVLLDFTNIESPKVLYTFPANCIYFKAHYINSINYFITNSSIISVDKLGNLIELNISIANSMELAGKLFIVININGKQQLIGPKGELIIKSSCNKIIINSGEAFVKCETDQGIYYYNVLNGQKTRDIAVVNASKPSIRFPTSSIQSVGDEVNGYKIITTADFNKHIINSKGIKIGSSTLHPINLYNANGKTVVSCIDSIKGQNVGLVRLEDMLEVQPFIYSNISYFLYFPSDSSIVSVTWKTNGLKINKFKTEFVMLVNDNEKDEALINENGGTVFITPYNIVRPIISKNFGLLIIVKNKSSGLYNICNQQGELLCNKWFSGFLPNGNTITLFSYNNKIRDLILLDLNTGKITQSKD